MNLHNMCVRKYMTNQTKCIRRRGCEGCEVGWFGAGGARQHGGAKEESYREQKREISHFVIIDLIMDIEKTNDHTTFI